MFSSDYKAEWFVEMICPPAVERECPKTWLGTIDGNSIVRASFPSHKELSTIDLRNHYEGKMVTVVAIVEYERHETEVFRPVRIITMEVFRHLDGLAKVEIE